MSRTHYYFQTLMPELPEVETIVRQLSPVVRGKKVIKALIIDEKLASSGLGLLAGARIQGLERLGKQLVFHLCDARGEEFYLGVHLRMTGRLIWIPARTSHTPIARKAVRFVHQQPRPKKHLRSILELEDGDLQFSDVRRFGTWTVALRREALLPEGLDPLSKELDAAKMKELLGNSKQPIKHWLLRQDRLVGLGNIYASEILFAARIRPDRAAGGLRLEEIENLRRATRAILLRAIKHCGTTFSDFQDSRGELGSYQAYLKVYMREGEKCFHCQKLIERCVMQGRGTYFCRKCQK